MMDKILAETDKSEEESNNKYEEQRN